MEHWFADLHIVQTSSAKAFVRLLCKQVVSVGCPLWATRTPNSACRVYLIRIDVGGGLRGARRLMASDCKQLPAVLILAVNCMQHPLHPMHKHIDNIV